MLLAGLNVIPLAVHAQDQMQINALVVKMEMQLQILSMELVLALQVDSLNIIEYLK